MPKFYKKLYQKTKYNKKIFCKELNDGFNKVYDKNIYKIKADIAKDKWQKVENNFLTIINDFNFKIKNQIFFFN
ncbi:hypothetical protein KAI92_04960, partial [Candidatus Parcubacteria bacterium]|nr:hypothetical protein [Candidatus Parcubacteria bacterium]